MTTFNASDWYGERRESWKPPAQPKARTGRRVMVRPRSPHHRALGRIAYGELDEREDEHVVIRFTHGPKAGETLTLRHSAIAEILEYE